jgi:hypothetical protein
MSGTRSDAYLMDIATRLHFTWKITTIGRLRGASELLYRYNGANVILIHEVGLYLVRQKSSKELRTSACTS